MSASSIIVARNMSRMRNANYLSVPQGLSKVVPWMRSVQPASPRIVIEIWSIQTIHSASLIDTISVYQRRDRFGNRSSVANSQSPFVARRVH